MVRNRTIIENLLTNKYEFSQKADVFLFFYKISFYCKQFVVLKDMLTTKSNNTKNTHFKNSR